VVVMPKSTTVALPLDLTMMLAGLMSRWVRPASHVWAGRSFFQVVLRQLLLRIADGPVVGQQRDAVSTEPCREAVGQQRGGGLGRVAAELPQRGVADSNWSAANLLHASRSVTSNVQVPDTTRRSLSCSASDVASSSSELSSSSSAKGLSQ